MPLFLALSILGFPFSRGPPVYLGSPEHLGAGTGACLLASPFQLCHGLSLPHLPPQGRTTGLGVRVLDPHLGCSARLTFVLLAQEEGDDCTLSVYRRLHNSLERSELSMMQGLPEPGRVRAEQRLRPTRPCAEDN